MLAAWQAGDAAAGRALYRRHGPAMRRFFCLRVTRREDVPDLLQETFLRCQRAQCNGSSSVLAFLRGIAYRVFLEYLRRLGRETGVCADDVDVLDLTAAQFDARDPEYVLDQQRSTRLLMKAMRRIPIRDQIVLEMRDWEELEPAVIAEILSSPGDPIPPGTVRRWRTVALERLRAMMKALAGSPAEHATTTMTPETWLRRTIAYAKEFARTPLRGARGGDDGCL